MTRVACLAALLGAAAVLSACTEDPQTIAEGRKVDSRAFDGAARAYTAGSWKAGDATAWEQQLKKRAQYQNEYARIAP